MKRPKSFTAKDAESTEIIAARMSEQQLVEKSQVNEFLARFYQFYDSAIRSASLRFSKGERALDLTIATRDSLATADERWVCVQISVQKVVELVIRECKKTTIVVPVDGLHILNVEENIALEFGGAFEPRSIDELRQSDAYVIGKTLLFEVQPYTPW